MENMIAASVNGAATLPGVPHNTSMNARTVHPRHSTTEVANNLGRIGGVTMLLTATPAKMSENPVTIADNALKKPCLMAGSMPGP